ncbi:MAG TPA: hypothetical protein VJK03_01780 [Candidatus Nanoarchaeia archaeon]|nr:hypothetical protein [Candidatus Nanoarchaeia archaeon]
MHQTRQEISTRLPLPRKGNKYVARAMRHRDSVPVILAVRDMLKIARTAREVKHMIHERLLKLNGKPVLDLHQSIMLFNIFEADKQYRLSLLPQGKFAFEELAKPENRLGKIVGKRLVKNGAIQLNLHDGTNVIAKDKSIAVGDSVYLDAKNKIQSHLPLEKGREVFIIAGRHQGTMGKIIAVTASDVTIQQKGGTTNLRKDSVVVLT